MLTEARLIKKRQTETQNKFESDTKCILIINLRKQLVPGWGRGRGRGMTSTHYGQVSQLRVGNSHRVTPESVRLERERRNEKGIESGRQSSNIV